MKKKQIRALSRLTSAETEKPVYLDLTEIIGVEADVLTQVYNPPPANTSQNAVFIQNDRYIMATRVTTKEGSSFLLKEHYLEVLAMVEGRDPQPAQIMYGKRTNT